MKKRKNATCLCICIVVIGYLIAGCSAWRELNKKGREIGERREKQEGQLWTSAETIVQEETETKSGSINTETKWNSEETEASTGETTVQAEQQQEETTIPEETADTTETEVPKVTESKTEGTNNDSNWGGGEEE